MLVFQKCNLYHFLNYKKKDTAFSKNTYHRFLNNASFNWVKFISLPNVLPQPTLPLIKEAMAAEPEKMLYFRDRKLQYSLSVMLLAPESKRAMCLWMHGLPTNHVLQIFWQRVWMLSVCSRTINRVIFTRAKSAGLIAPFLVEYRYRPYICRDTGSRYGKCTKILMVMVFIGKGMDYEKKRGSF